MFKVITHYFPSNTLYRVLFDVGLLFGAIMVAALWMYPEEAAAVEMTVFSAFVFAVTMILLNNAVGLYRFRVLFSLDGGGVGRLALALVLSVPVAYLVAGSLPWNGFSSGSPQILVVGLLVAVLVLRGVLDGREGGSPFLPRTLVLGTGHDARMVARVLDGGTGQRRAEIVGFCTTGNDESVAVPNDRILDTDIGLLELVRRERVTEIIVAQRERRGGVLPIRELLDCKVAGIAVYDLSSFFERTQGQVPIESLRASWLIYGDGFRQGWARTAVKRTFDLAASLGLLLVFMPIMLVTGLAILIEDRGPVFYRQNRVGRGGRVFRVIKFRSMRVDAEQDGKPRWAASNDDRTTRTGRIIRRLRIDEIPQLFNVLSGEMSLVGPRPERPFFVDQLTQQIPYYAVRHSVKPGVTGWAQVRYHYGASVDDAANKLQYDLYYVKNHNLVLDTLILFETVRVVLMGEGAH